VAFDGSIRALFKYLGYPFSEQKAINGKPDFVLPSESHFRENPTDCIIFTVKRTLRERWRQIVTEGSRGLLFFLATLDDSQRPSALRQMQDERIYLVVLEGMKESIPPYTTALNVISYEDFFEDYLDPAVERWKRSGTLEEEN